MKLVDLSHPITESMPVYPGTEPPTLRTACTRAEHGFEERILTLYSHTGTHLDAPCHILEHADTLDHLGPDRFFGPATVLACALGRGRAIEREHLASHEARIRKADFVLLHTGWSKFWGSKAYYSDYPVLSPEAALWLAGFKLKGVGVDAISVDAADTADYPVHRAILGSGAVVVENLTNLALLADKKPLFSCLPLKIEQGDGSPVRAVAIYF